MKAGCTSERYLSGNGIKARKNRFVLEKNLILCGEERWLFGRFEYSPEISLICLRFLQLEGHYNDKRNWTVYTSEFKYHHYKFKFCFQFVLLSSYSQSR